jgi:hypothetical protein
MDSIVERGTTVPNVLLSYDVSGSARALSVRVAQLIYGRKEDQRDPPPYIRRPGVTWVGQSVLLLPEPLAQELAEKLRRLGAVVTTARVAISGAELAAFRRRTRRGSGV